MNISYNDIVSYCSTIATPWSRPMKKDTKRRFFKLVSNIKVYILCVLLSNFFEKERKLFRTPQTSFLMLKAKQINSSATLKPSSIKV
jgi:hypothetical protein